MYEDSTGSSNQLVSNTLELSDIPLEIWQCCIFEYWIGPIHQVSNISNISNIMKFKKEIYPLLLNGLNLVNIKALHKCCCTLSRKFRQIFLVVNDFWRRVSNIFEMVVYWKRYESMQGFSLATGDIYVYQAIPIVKMQKLIEATEMNVNREYCEIIDPSICRYNSFDVELNEVENDVNNIEMENNFEKRMEKLMISEEKLERIRTITQLDAYDLFLHKALILSLDMISYFDSERFCENNYYTTLEKCCLLSKGLFTESLQDSEAIGLLIDMDYQITDITQFSSKYIAISINLTEWSYQGFVIPNHIQYLCFQFSEITFFEDGALFYEDFLQDQDEFPNVRDLTIRISSPSYGSYLEFCERIEKNIIAVITRRKFPKLLRISLQGFSKIENLLECDILSELLYVEIIPVSRRSDVFPNWTGRKVHNLINQKFIEKDSIIHHLVTHANIVRNSPDADYDSIEEYYDITKENFVASISHSSIIEYYEQCNE